MSPTPELILVMRHAEKPADPFDPNLSPEGYARAEKLATFIPQKFGVPDFIFAAASSKHSARPYQTVEPLSKKTKIGITLDFADQDYAALASTLLSSPQYAGKKILVCWHHGNIPSLMVALGCKSETYPDPWDPKVFDLILKVQFADGTPIVEKVPEVFEDGVVAGA